MPVSPPVASSGPSSVPPAAVGLPLPAKPHAAPPTDAAPDDRPQPADVTAPNTPPSSSTSPASSSARVSSSMSPPSSLALSNSAPQFVDTDANDELEPLEDSEMDALREEIFDLIRCISDPEHPTTLERLGVVYKSGVCVSRDLDGHECASIEFKPTVPHCSLATLIGLCIRTKVDQAIPNIKMHVHIQKGAHATDEQISKQLNDKERARAAMENPVLRETVERLIKEDRPYE